MAKGSHDSYGDWESKVCEGCGERITKSGKNARGAMYRRGLETDTPRSRHGDCKWVKAA